MWSCSVVQGVVGLPWLHVDLTAWSQQFDNQGGMRDYFLVILCCWVVVVPAPLAPAEQVVARA